MPGCLWFHRDVGDFIMQDEGDLHRFDEMTTGQKVRAWACLTVVLWIIVGSLGLVAYRLFSHG